MKKKTMVIGASTNPDRYSNKAIQSLRNHNHEVVAIGLKPGEVAGVPIITDYPAFSDIDTITLYVGPERQPVLYDYIMNTKPKRVIFNPGTENDELEALLQDNGIEFTEACTLVLLSINRY